MRITLNDILKIFFNQQIIYLQKKLRSYKNNNKNNGNTIKELNDKIQSSTNEKYTLKQENKSFMQNK